MELIKVENLTFDYGKKGILKNILFSIKKEEFVGIIGPNGAGKTTLIRILSRISQPVSGKVYYKGLDIHNIPPVLFSREVSFLPSNLDIYFSYTVAEFVSMARFPFTGRFGKFTEKDREIVENILELLEIDNLRNMKIWELSEGEKQRTFLAQAIAQKPSLLILDEPTAHLDIGHQFAIMDLLQKLNEEEHITILTVLHDLNLASEYCNKLFLLNEGRIFIQGIPEKVLTYENIEKVYNTKVLVDMNPLTKKPYVFGLPVKLINKKR